MLRVERSKKRGNGRSGAGTVGDGLGHGEQAKPGNLEDTRAPERVGRVRPIPVGLAHAQRQQGMLGAVPHDGHPERFVCAPPTLKVRRAPSGTDPVASSASTDEESLCANTAQGGEFAQVRGDGRRFIHAVWNESPSLVQAGMRGGV